MDVDVRQWAVRQAGDPAGRRDTAATRFARGFEPFRGMLARPAAPTCGCRRGQSWLADHLPDARLHLREDDGHLGVIEHLDEVLETLARRVWLSESRASRHTPFD